MTSKERQERQRLHLLWATRRATAAQIRRCMELDRRSEIAERASQKRGNCNQIAGWLKQEVSR